MWGSPRALVSKILAAAAFQAALSGFVHASIVLSFGSQNITPMECFISRTGWEN